MIRNIHERIIKAPVERVSCLVDKLGSSDDLLWPGDRWPAMRLDRPLQVGATGGHSDVKYTVSAYEPGRRVVFRFTNDDPDFIGTHSFEVEKCAPGKVRIKHLLIGRLKGLRSRIFWRVFIKSVHEAVVADAFDRAEAYATGKAIQPRRWSLWVRFLRRLVPIPTTPNYSKQSLKAA